LALFALGLRYRINAPGLPGRPDIAFTRWRVAVFVDGDFWHGRDWESRRVRLARGSNADYWLSKIGRNIERDQTCTGLLVSMGWTVVRVWETDVLPNPEQIATAIASLAGRAGIGGAALANRQDHHVVRLHRADQGRSPTGTERRGSRRRKG
jgi:DNA mismatch endonuclease (patch repair protein)